MPIIEISDPADPRIEPYLQVRERDIKGRDGRFVIEGEVVLRTAIQRGRYTIESVLLASNRLAGLSDIFKLLSPTVPIYVAERPVLDRIIGFSLHRGIVAMGLRGTPAHIEELMCRPSPALLMVAAGIANHDNMGGLFRNAAAFGLDGVLLDHTSCDPLYRKSIRVSAGAALIIPFAQGGSIDVICSRLRSEGFEVLATSPKGRESLSTLRLEQQSHHRRAVVFGAEGAGLPASLLQTLRTVRIDMAAGFDSLNVATTSGIVLHHLRNG